MRSDTENNGQVGSGIILADPELTFLTRKSVLFVQIFLQNGAFRLRLHTYFLRKILEMLKSSCSSHSVSLKFENYLVDLV
jgi:hypothetical protein